MDFLAYFNLNHQTEKREIQRKYNINGSYYVINSTSHTFVINNFVRVII